MTSPPVTDRATGARTSTVFGAVLWMCGALLSFSLIAVTGREASKVIPTTELMFWRGIIGITVLLSILFATGGRLSRVMSLQPRLQIGRSVIHFGAQFGWLYCLTLIPLAELFALEFTAPLWVAVLAPLLLGERVTPIRVAAAILGFIGALIVIRPGTASLSYGAVLALASAAGFACSMIATKQLTKTDGALTILIWMNGLQAMIAAGFLVRGITWPDPVTWIYVVLVAVLGLTAHYSLTRAFALADASIVAPMDFLRLPLIAVVGAYLYNEPLSIAVLIGGVCIVGANLLNVFGERARTVK